MKKHIAILGSTGSIGTQALEVIKQFPDKFELEVLTANTNADLLIKQAKEFNPNVVVIADETKYKTVFDALNGDDIKVYAGEESVSQVVQMQDITIVLNALVGYAGFKPTIKTLEAGKELALANKESIVVGGELVTKIAKEKKVGILPVDSEHSAIFQCLAGEFFNPIEKIILTASGGPFFKKTLQELKTVTKAQALKHPNWEMGAKITIDSATLINKGLEVIEAKWLFDLNPHQIEVIIHPQSIIHSMVQFNDGSIKAQLGLPDMKLPIQYALTYPERYPSNFERLDFGKLSNFEFYKPDLQRFKSLALAYAVLEQKGNAACILNAANEIAVNAFLHEQINFSEITDIIEETLSKASFIKSPDFSDYVQTNIEARQIASEIVQKTKS